MCPNVFVWIVDVCFDFEYFSEHDLRSFSLKSWFTVKMIELNLIHTEIHLTPAETFWTK